MSTFYKALIVVMIVTTLVFYLARPLMRRFMTDADFTVRRNVWLGLTLAAFLMPNYWTYVLLACVILLYGVKRDSNPAALYVFLLLAMVPVGLDLPTFGLVRQVFVLEHLRLLSLVVLIPAALRLARNSQAPPGYGHVARPVDRSRRHVDMLILLYAALQIILLLPYGSATATLRRVVLIGIDVGLPYYVLSRSCRTRESLVDVMAAFALAMFVLAPLGVFEFIKGWLLYGGLQDHWGADQIMVYLRRGNFLRAQVTSGHSIVLGYAMMVAFGFWLFLQSRVASVRWRALAMLTLLAGIVVPWARGPWLGAIVVVLVYLAQGPNRGPRVAKFVGVLALLGVIALASPYGDQVVERLPFVGALDDASVVYRQRLAASSWLLIQQNPLFGSPGYIAYLEELRQGQGIIDLVNTYASIALGYGLLTLAVFVGFFGLIVLRCARATRRLAAIDPDLSLIGASLVACLAGALVTIATASFYLSIAQLTWSLAGLGVAYAEFARRALLQAASRPGAVQAGQAPWEGFPRPAATRAK